MTTRVSYTGDGATTDFNFGFVYIDRDYVLATIEGASTTSFTFLNDNQIRFDSAPANGAAILIFRLTSADALVTYTDSSELGEDELNLAYTQAVHIAEEARDLQAAVVGEIEVLIQNEIDNYTTPGGSTLGELIVELEALLGDTTGFALLDGINTFLRQQIIEPLTGNGSLAISTQAAPTGNRRYQIEAPEAGGMSISFTNDDGSVGVPFIEATRTGNNADLVSFSIGGQEAAVIEPAGDTVTDPQAIITLEKLNALGGAGGGSGNQNLAFTLPPTIGEGSLVAGYIIAESGVLPNTTGIITSLLSSANSADTVCDIQRDGVSIGTLTISAAGAATFTLPGGDAAFTPGQRFDMFVTTLPVTFFGAHATASLTPAP